MGNLKQIMIGAMGGFSWSHLMPLSKIKEKLDTADKDKNHFGRPVVMYTQVEKNPDDSETLPLLLQASIPWETL